MRRMLLCVYMALCLLSCSDDTAGTATDVNSGSLSGVLENKGTPYQEPIDLYLRESQSGSIVDYQQVTDGNYTFTSIHFGTYDLVASIEDNSVTLGFEEKINIEKGSSADIEVSRIVKKGFQVSTKGRGELTLDLPLLSNVHSELPEPNRVLLTFAESSDTLTFPLTYSLNNEKDTLMLRMVQELNHSYTIETTEDQADLQILNLETTLLTGDGSDSSTIIIDGIIE